MQPDYSFLIKTLDLDIPPIGLYDADELPCFEPAQSPAEGKHVCIFAYFKTWINGKITRLERDTYGCGGCGTWWFNRQTKTRDEYIDFLANDEGLKASEEIMGEWFDQLERYEPEHRYLYAGPLHGQAYDYLRSVTFFVNPDQLSVLMAGAQYFNRPSEPDPVIADYGSGCMEMLTHVVRFEEPKAIIGTTDMAMRRYIPSDLLGFSVNKPMFELLCRLDNRSFLGKHFLKDLKKARGGKIS
jgi:hypothetical protein